MPLFYFLHLVSTQWILYPYPRLAAPSKWEKLIGGRRSPDPTAAPMIVSPEPVLTGTRKTWSIMVHRTQLQSPILFVIRFDPRVAEPDRLFVIANLTCLCLIQSQLGQTSGWIQTTFIVLLTRDDLVQSDQSKPTIPMLSENGYHGRESCSGLLYG